MSKELSYEKKGYLESDFKLFHLKENMQRSIDFHYHDFHKILLFLQGDISYSIEGKSYLLQPMDLVLIKAGEIHRPVIHSDQTYERIILYVSPAFINTYRTEDCNLEQCFIHTGSSSHVLRIPSLKNKKLFQTFHDLEKALNEQDFAQDLNRRVLFLQLMILLNRAFAGREPKYIETNSSNEKILEIIRYLNEHLQENISIDDLAGHFYISKYYLMHTFKEETGYSIGSYLSTKRLLLAREAIQNGISATDACYECGFRNYSTFFRAYKKCFGKSPTS